MSKNKKMRKMCAKKKKCEERKFAIKGITNTFTREHPLFTKANKCVERAKTIVLYKENPRYSKVVLFALHKSGIHI